VIHTLNFIPAQIIIICTHLEGKYVLFLLFSIILCVYFFLLVQIIKVLTFVNEKEKSCKNSLTPDSNIKSLYCPNCLMVYCQEYRWESKEEYKKLNKGVIFLKYQYILCMKRLYIDSLYVVGCVCLDKCNIQI
jgi:predicted RNA-binding Zn-ribbon protein involved in translation (DUF1610 family)